MPVSVLIGADVAPVDAAVEAFSKGDPSALLDDALLSLWRSCDLRAFDLEIPFTGETRQIPKCGPALRAPESAFRGVLALCEGPSFVTLANNHILDMGERGLADTISLLKRAGIPSGGAGSSAAEASRPVFLRAGEETVGFLCCCENEFSCAGEDTPGAAPFDPLETPDAVADAKAACDHLIVLYHGGPEEWPYPTPGLQKRLRRLAEKGADAVICQHGHIIGCMETYRDVPIVYGQGNFLFAASDGAPCWREGLLLEVLLEKGSAARIIPHPILSDGSGRRAASPAEKEAVLLGFEERSREIADPARVRERTRERARMLSRQLGRALLGNSLPLRALNAVTGRKPLRTFYDADARLRLIDFFRCETLQELYLTALSDSTGEERHASRNGKEE